MDSLRRSDAPHTTASPAIDPGVAVALQRDSIFFAAVAGTRMPMVVTDPAQPGNPVIAANEAFVAMSGYPIDEIVGRNCRFMQGERTDPEAIASIRDAVEARREISIELLNYRKDGSTFWNALFVSPVFDDHGALRYFFASQIDVSRRREAEAALVQAQKMEALGQLTGGIAHDFNNLLQVMQGHLELLDRRLAVEPVDALAIRKTSQGIRGAVGKASTLTQQLLAFARKQHLEGRLDNLNGLIGHLTDRTGRTFGADMKIVMQLDPALDNCRIDPMQFEAALYNLLLNARDAMQGRGTVTIRTSNVSIEAEDPRPFDGLEAGRYVVVAVTDDGPGIPREILPRVMEPFFTTKDEGKGTGLGLSMVHGFVKQSGGGVQIQSEVGLGTTIQLRFPTIADGAPVEVEAENRQERGGREVVLVVDDRPEVLDVATTLLETLGYPVLSAGSGIEAVRLVESLATAAQPALLFSDVIMPGGMNGYVLARKLRSRNPSMKVLLTTGYAGDVQGPESNAEFDVIRKPYKLDELARRVRLVLDRPTIAR